MHGAKKNINNRQYNKPAGLSKEFEYLFFTAQQIYTEKKMT